VNAFAIFIASVSDEAERIKQELPLGRAHVCLDPAALPQTFKEIFTESIKDD
jgi:hypothetical protein